MMGTRQHLKSGEEYDLVYWKGKITYNYLRRGSHSIKRGLARRMRQESKKRIAEEQAQE